MAEPARGRQAEARRNDRAVLDAARLVFAGHGPDAPVSAVAAAAGVGMGTLYRRYASKEALLQHLCQASLEQQIATAEACLAAACPPDAAPPAVLCMPDAAATEASLPDASAGGASLHDAAAGEASLDDGSAGGASLDDAAAAEASLHDAAGEASLPDAAGALSGAPWDAFASFVTICVSFRAGAFTSIAGTIATTPEMNATAQRAHELLERLVRNAQQAGALRQDVGSVDIHRLIELFSRRRPEPDDGAHQRLLAVALDGLRTTAHQLLPGSPPTWASSVSQWVRD